MTKNSSCFTIFLPMKLVLFSTNSNKYVPGIMNLSSLPTCFDQWEEVSSFYPDLKITLVMQLPGMFLLDIFEGKIKKSSKIDYVFIDENCDSAEEIANFITSLNPDVAFAVTYWAAPFDWLPIKDALVTEILKKNGIKAFCHSADSAFVCFDKFRMADFFGKNGFNCAKNVFVHHEMFFIHRSKNELKTNVYREYVLQKIKELKFPVVVKDTTGLSSFGMDVCKTYNEVVHVLNSKKNNGDRLVEEFIEGDSFGAEIYGSSGNFAISPVLINSVNQFGLTSPKQNVKLGPVLNSNFKIDELKKELLRLAELLKFEGIAQVDLIFSNKKWYFVEVNSRISGMTQTIAASYGMSLYKFLIELILSMSKNEPFLENKNTNCKYVMNLKFPLLEKELMKKLASLPFVFCVNQIENKGAKQLREVGYLEVIFGNTKELSSLMQELDEINALFPNQMEKVFYENAKKLAKTISQKTF